MDRDIRSLKINKESALVKRRRLIGGTEGDNGQEVKGHKRMKIDLEA